MQVQIRRGVKLSSEFSNMEAIDKLRKNCLYSNIGVEGGL